MATAFEQLDGGWVYYANATSQGVIVTPEERELYLEFKPLAFRAAILIDSL